MIKCCVFDLDGTILDTITTITHYVNKSLHKFGYPEITEQQCKYFVGNGAKLLIERVMHHLGVYGEERINEVFCDYDGEYNANPYCLTSAFRGIFELLSELKARGVKLAVISNKQDSITKQAVAHFYPGVFDEVVGGREGVALKPSPDAVNEIIGRLRVQPCELAFVGDTSVDIETGRNAGAAAVIGVLWGFRTADELGSPDFIAESPSDILDFLREKLVYEK